MKKITAFGVILAILLFACIIVSAQSFNPVVNRIGISGNNLRFLVKNDSLPVGLTASMLEDAVMNGIMIYKSDEEGKGDIAVINSEIKGFEPRDATSVLVVASNEFLNVNNIDDGTSKYDCRLTVTMKDVEAKQRSFNVKYLRGGSSSYMRFVVSASDLPQDLNVKDLKGAVITGTLAHNSDSALNLELNNNIVSAELEGEELVLNVADSESASKANFTIGRVYTATLKITIPVYEEGVSISGVSTSGVNASFFVKNMTEEAIENAWVIVAAYNGSELVDAKTKTISVEAGSVSEKLEFTFEPTKPWELRLQALK